MFFSNCGNPTRPCSSINPCLLPCLQKSPKNKINMVSAPRWNLFDIFFTTSLPRSPFLDATQRSPSTAIGHVNHFELSSTIFFGFSPDMISNTSQPRPQGFSRSSATSTFSRETLRHSHFLVCDWSVQ